MQLARQTAHMVSSQGSAGVTLHVLQLATAAQHVQKTTTVTAEAAAAAAISRQREL
jgi:hypothetical protein